MNFVCGNAKSNAKANDAAGEVNVENSDQRLDMNGGENEASAGTTN